MGALAPIRRVSYFFGIPYQPLTCNGQGRLWSESLKLWVGLWPGDILRDETVWLRLYTPEGRLVLTPAEAKEQQIGIERQKAEADLRRLQELPVKRGIEL
ncbi:MAG: hypothetical protein GY862_34965 [Gammaproteobacteria bacterium]|nr:hypothetical protein [Gammaproteobacteria bacterium]